MDKPTIDIRDLRVRRGGTLILPGISLKVPRGRVTGLLGPSGSGKTTLMRAMVGVQIVESGQVSVLGQAAGTPGRSPTPPGGPSRAGTWSPPRTG